MRKNKESTSAVLRKHPWKKPVGTFMFEIVQKAAMVIGVAALVYLFVNKAEVGKVPDIPKDPVAPKAPVK